MIIKNRTKTQLMVITAIFAAIIFVLTRFLQIPVPATNGYLHFGDSIIYFAACLLPHPYSMFAGAIGGSFADLLSPYAIWTLPTIIIKSLIALPFTSKSDKILTNRNIFMLVISGVISITGYFFAGWIIGNFGSAIAGLTSNFIQALGSAVIFIFIGGIFDKANLKKYI